MHLPSLLSSSCAIALCGALAGGACRHSPPATQDAKTSQADAPASDAVFDPALPAGTQMAWLLSVINDPAKPPFTEGEIHEHFSPIFLKQVPVENLITVLTDIRAQLRSLTPHKPLVVHPHDMTLLAMSAIEQKWIVSVAVSRQQPYLIEGLFFQPAPREKIPAPTSFNELDAQLADLGAHTHALIARIDPEQGTCSPIHALDAASPVPIASTFKLYVLLALARAVEAGEMTWDDSLPIRDALKSLPSGSMQTHAEGSSFPISTYADSMLSISDNTATDHLMVHLGPTRLAAAVVAASHHDPALLSPMLTTQELFKLKLLATDAQRDQYVSLDPAGREVFRQTDLTALPQVTLPDAVIWTGPRQIETLEWFASTQDLCALHATFVKHASTPAYARAFTSMSLNDAGIGLDPARWRYVGYKGGAEPGVLVMTWLVESVEHEWYSVTLALSETIPQIDEGALVVLGRAAVNLIEASKKP